MESFVGKSNHTSGLCPLHICHDELGAIFHISPDSTCTGVSWNLRWTWKSSTDAWSIFTDAIISQIHSKLVMNVCEFVITKKWVNNENVFFDLCQNMCRLAVRNWADLLPLSTTKCKNQYPLGIHVLFRTCCTSGAHKALTLKVHAFWPLYVQQIRNTVRSVPEHVLKWSDQTARPVQGWYTLYQSWVKILSNRSLVNE